MDASFSLRLFVTDSEVTYYYGWEKRSPQPEAKDRTWQSKFSLDLANLALWIVSKAVLYFSKKNVIRFTQSKLIHFKLEKSEISTNFFENIHYYRTGFCSGPFVPVVFGPGTIGGFCPRSNG